MKEKTFKVLNGLLTAFLLIMLVLNFYNILQRNIMENQMPKIFGYGYAVVISGSMEPEISVNDIVYVKEQDTYAVGDIITYEKYDSYITHRIIDIKDGDYITKGDSNNSADLDPVMTEQIRGKVVYVLPFFGSVVLYMKTPIGTLVTLLVSLICLEVPYRIRLSKARKKGKKKYKRIAKDMERIQTEIKKLDEEAAANPDLPEQQMVIDDPELRYQTFLEQMLQAESINDLCLPGGLSPAKPLDGEVVIGGSTEADADYVNRVAARNAREKVESERAALLAQGYTFASESKEADAEDTQIDAAKDLDMQENASPEFEEQGVCEATAELSPGSAMAAMLSIASAMNTDFNLTNEDFEKGNEELLKLEAELSGLPVEEPEVVESLSEDAESIAEETENTPEEAESAPEEVERIAEAVVESTVSQVTEEPSAGCEGNAECMETLQIDEEELARLRRIAEIESELYGTEYVDPLETLSMSEEYVPDAPVGYSPVEHIEEEVPATYSPEEIVAYAESAQVYADAVPEEELSNDQFAVTDFVPEEPQGYAAAGGYVIDEEELARLRRIAEIEAELYGTEYVDPLENMQGYSDESETQFTADTSVSDEYTQIMSEEYVPDTIVGYTAAEHVENSADADAAETEAELAETEATEPNADAVTVGTVLEAAEGELTETKFAGNVDAELEDEEAARLARIAEIEAELASAPDVSSKKRALSETLEELKHKRAVDRHSRKGPPVYIPEEGIWDISVDEYSLNGVLDKDEI